MLEKGDNLTEAWPAVSLMALMLALNFSMC